MVQKTETLIFIALQVQLTVVYCFCSNRGERHDEEDAQLMVDAGQTLVPDVALKLKNRHVSACAASFKTQMSSKICK